MNNKHLAPNTLLGNRYVVVKLLAEGGMGTVYEARDGRLGGTVALKQAIYTDEYLQRHFEREARLLASLRHIGLPRVIDHFNDENGQFLVMEFIPGQDLKSLLDGRGQPFSHKEVLAWGDQLLNVLEYLHSKKPPVIHRDIKPQNLKINDEGLVVLLDFGLAKGAAPDMTQLGAGNTLLGCTLEYAPLEQLMRIPQLMRPVTSLLDPVRIKQMMSEYADERTDLYSLAATMYHLMTGATPANAIDRFAALFRGFADPLRPANELCPDLPLHIASFLTQAMGLERDKRFGSATAMRRALLEAATDNDVARVAHKEEREDRKPRIAFKDVKIQERRISPQFPRAVQESLTVSKRDLVPGGGARKPETTKSKAVRINITPPTSNDKERNLRQRVDFTGGKQSHDAKQSSPRVLKLKPIVSSENDDAAVGKAEKPQVRSNTVKLNRRSPFNKDPKKD